MKSCQRRDRGTRVMHATTYTVMWVEILWKSMKWEGNSPGKYFFKDLLIINNSFTVE